MLTVPYQQMLYDSAMKFFELFWELSFLFLIISFFIALVQQKLPDHKIRAILGGKRGRGYFTAALLGAVTPFCTCSTIPMLVGLLKARAGFGPTMTFLFTSPLLNPLVIALFIPVLGWEITVFYASLALSVSLLAGFLLSKLGFERYVNPDLLHQKSECCTGSCTTTQKPPAPYWQEAWSETWSMFKKMFPYMLLAMFIGAAVYGFVPQNFFSDLASADNPGAIPVAALIGIPLYMRVSTLLPMVGAFLTKGVSMGAIIALTIGSGGASLPEVIMLKKLFYTPLLLAFLFVVFSMAVIGGYGVNLLLTP